MFCKKCGKEISNNAKFCNRCGTSVSGEVRVATNVNYNSYNSYSNPNNNPTPNYTYAYASSGPSLMRDLLYWEGRRGRQKYMLVMAITTILGLFLISTVILGVFNFYVSYVNMVKRLHDCNKSALLASVSVGVSGIGGILLFIGFFQSLAGSNTTTVMGFLLYAAGIVISIWLCTVRGDAQANQYGPVPGDRF